MVRVMDGEFMGGVRMGRGWGGGGHVVMGGWNGTGRGWGGGGCHGWGGGVMGRKMAVMGGGVMDGKMAVLGGEVGSWVGRWLSSVGRWSHG